MSATVQEHAANGEYMAQTGLALLSDGFDQLDPVTKIEAAAQRGIVQYIGNRVLISCREAPSDPCQEAEAEILNELSDREYDTLYRRAYGWGYAAIAEDMGLSFSTVRAHLHNGYAKITPRGQGGEEATSFIPIEARDVEVFSPFRVGGDDNLESKLTKQQQQICDLLIAGLSRKEIALEKWLSVSTVRTHISNICAIFGLSTQVIDRPGIILRRFATASRNLEAYYTDSTLDKTAGDLQPKS
jgi:DNA-binding NarL/FixJ family response regulator